MGSDAGTVLVVEDDEDIADMIRAALIDAGLEVRTALDGLAGLRAYREEQPDCIILDVMMPRLTGWEVLSAIRQEDTLTPIVMLTALRNAESEALKRGVDDFIPKPFDLDELVFRVENRVAVQQRLRGFQAAKEAAVREVVERYAETIPRELNQPLAEMLGLAELLLFRQPSSSELHELASDILKAGNVLVERIEKFSQLREYRPRQANGIDLIALDPEPPTES